MSYTRANIETVLVKRRSGTMVAAGLAVTYAGSNADLNDPIGFAIRQLGGSVTTITSVADADVVTVDSSNIDALIDIAELRLLRNIKGNLSAVDTRSGPFDEKFSQLIDSVKDDIAAMEDKIRTEYGVGGVSIQSGNLLLDFADHNEGTTNDMLDLIP